MAAKNISELNLDEFTRIQGPERGSARDGSRVMVGRAGDRDSCVKMADGKLQVTGSDEFRRTVEEAYEAKQTPSSGFGSAPYRPQPTPEPEPTLSKLMPATQGPEIETFDVGYYWNEFHQSKDAIYKKLYGPEANFQQQSMFERNNEHLQDMVLPGELVILANNPTTLAEKDRLILLKAQAKEASEGIQQLTPAEAATVYQYVDVLDLAVNHDTGLPSAVVGGISTALGQRFGDLYKAIDDLNFFYVSHTNAAQGGRFSPEFYQGRKAHLAKLNNAVERFTMSRVNLPDYPKLKHRLGLSTKSITHNWRTVSSKGEIPALGARLKNIAIAVKGAQRVGYVSVVLDSVTGIGLTREAYRQGDMRETVKVASKQTGRVVGGFYGGTWAALNSARAAVAVAGGVALIFGVTLSAPVAAVIAVGAGLTGGYLGGNIISDVTGTFGESLAEHAMDLIGVSE
ncbi:TPA: hypothetical protein QHA87_000357 [Aeromonas dhakensis]|nr:hypothetical protein [Aeromonas dhakensis]HEB4979514.1 hypothetical protein [Aeromonas dhakensis]